MRLDQIVALNDEIEALVRAGVPLERGLTAASRDYQGRLRHVLRDLGGRLEAGERLPEAMLRLAPEMPEVYRAIIEAGLRSGRLADALQGMAKIGQGRLEARRTIVLACLYPFLIVVLAYALFLFFLAVVFPRFLTASGSFEVGSTWVVRLLESAGETILYWSPLLPMVLVGLLTAWRRSARSKGLDGSPRLGASIGRIPWVGPMVANYRVANFVDLLAHLVDHDVPLDQSLRLAAEASGSGRLRESAARFADEVTAGATTFDPAGRSGQFPPLVAWMLTSGFRQSALVPSLGHLARTYRRKAERQAEVFRIVLPGLLILVIGTLAVLTYGVLLFVPLRHLWDGLANPLN